MLSSLLSFLTKPHSLPPLLSAATAQATVAARHYLTGADAAAIAASGVPVLVCVAEGDEIVPPGDQRRLAELLGADTHETPGGHLGCMADFSRFSQRVVGHMMLAIATA